VELQQNVKYLVNCEHLWKRVISRFALPLHVHVNGKPCGWYSFCFGSRFRSILQHVVINKPAYDVHLVFVKGFKNLRWIRREVDNLFGVEQSTVTRLRLVDLLTKPNRQNASNHSSTCKSRSSEKKRMQRTQTCPWDLWVLVEIFEKCRKNEVSAELFASSHEQEKSFPLQWI